MKHCTTCQQLFPDPLQVCPADNAPLRVARELEPGMIIRGKYIVLEWIGAGGMASVYRARHRLLNEMRAVKVVSPRFATDEDFLKRFRHEAAIARRLRHENAVWVEDLDELEDGRPFIAMEFLQGHDLRKLIKDQGPLSVKRSLNIGAQVASALSAAHKLGVIHRDIKPDNIFITRDAAGNEIAKVLDFGIAKAREGVLQGGYTATQTGVIIGTPEYMSPEQAEGQLGDKLDGRSDLYSLGVVLYEMLTGRLPFESDTPLGMCLHHLQTVPRPPHEARPDLDIPEGVSAILMKALEKRRERRFQSAEDMLAALRSPAQGKQPAAHAGAIAPTRVTEPAAKPLAPAATATAPQKAVASSQPQENNRVPSRAIISYPQKAGSRRRRRILVVAAVVAICAAAGYLLLNAIQQHNAELRAHDALVQQQIAAQLRSSPLLQGRSGNLKVSFNSGTATLSGLAPAADRETAASVAREVPGVTNVVNNITASGPPPVNTQTAQTSAPSESNTKQAQAQVSLAQRQLLAITVRDPKVSRINELMQSGKEALDHGKYAEARQNFKKVLYLDPKNTQAKIGLDLADKGQKTEQEVLGPKQ